MRISVVLPAPFGPSRPTISPRSTSNDTSSSASPSPPRLDAPYVFVTPRTLIKSATRLLQAAIAQGAVVLAAEMADLVEQRSRDRLIQLARVTDGAQQVAPVEHDGPLARVALQIGRARRRCSRMPTRVPGPGRHGLRAPFA